MPTFQETIASLRAVSKDIGETLEDVADSPWYPLKDAEFWDTLDRIEQAGATGDASQTKYLAGFILIDDLGPLGRAMFLATAAVAALSEMPDAAAALVEETSAGFSTNIPYYQKIGYCKIIAASNLSDAPQLTMMQHDPDERIRTRVAKLYGWLMLRSCGKDETDREDRRQDED